MLEQLVVYTDQLKRHKPSRRGDGCGTYGSHVAPWHAPHALKREYTTVLHLHKLSSLTIGPVYDSPGVRAGTENAVRGENGKVGQRKMTDSLRRTLTPNRLRQYMDFD
jgi:hypothetical protein